MQNKENQSVHDKLNRVLRVRRATPLETTCVGVVTREAMETL